MEADQFRTPNSSRTVREDETESEEERDPLSLAVFPTRFNSDKQSPTRLEHSISLRG